MTLKFKRSQFEDGNLKDDDYIRTIFLHNQGKIQIDKIRQSSPTYFRITMHTYLISHKIYVRNFVHTLDAEIYLLILVLMSLFYLKLLSNGTLSSPNDSKARKINLGIES